MSIFQPSLTILITTKNRKDTLATTLDEIKYMFNDNQVECIICDDGSSDATLSFLNNNYPTIKVIRNSTSRGLIYSRNRLLNLVTTDYAISLDDDAHFISKNPLPIIHDYFLANQKCAVIAFRIFWGEKTPENIMNYEIAEQVKSFVGCGHAWRMKDWKTIPNYPEWFIFYGEEEFASYTLFKLGKEIHYLPEIFVHHRVNIKVRKMDEDYLLRLRRSIRSGWYLYFIFYPWNLIPQKLAYSFYMQIKLKVMKGDIKVLLVLAQAVGDLLINMRKLLLERNNLSNQELNKFNSIPDTKIYWRPINKSTS